MSIILINSLGLILQSFFNVFRNQFFYIFYKQTMKSFCSNAIETLYGFSDHSQSLFKGKERTLFLARCNSNDDFIKYTEGSFYNVCMSSSERVKGPRINGNSLHLTLRFVLSLFCKSLTWCLHIDNF